MNGRALLSKGGIRFVVGASLAALTVVLASVVATGCAAGDETEEAFGDPYIPTGGGISTGGGSTDIGGSTFSVDDSQGSESEGSTSSELTGTTSQGSQTSLTSLTSLTTQTTNGMTSMGSGEDCPEPCGPPANDCYADEGWCENGICVYGPKFEGEPCDDGEACTANDTCDGMGNCVAGEIIDCSPPANAQGGACVNGACQGFECVAPYENCDGDWDNGCEIPTGVPNQCNDGGLTTEGCGTAYCGSLDDPDYATNFGSYYCYTCSNCHVVGGGQVQWCEHATGDWYPADVGACGSYEDLVCAP